MATALREVLVEFTIKVDDTQLKAADAAITAFTQKLVAAEDQLRKLGEVKLPKIDQPAAPGAGAGAGGAATSEQQANAWQRANSAARRLTDGLMTLFRGQAQLTEAKAKGIRESKKSAQAKREEAEASLTLSQRLARELREITGLNAARKRLGSESSRAAQGDPRPTKNVQNGIKDTKKEATGLLGVLGQLRRAWGLFQFAASSGLVVGSLVALTKQMGDAADQAFRLGMSLEEFQVLDAYAQKAGLSTAQLQNTVLALAKNAKLAAEGGKSQAKAFKELGVDVQDANGKLKPTIDLYVEVASAAAAVENGANRAALAQATMGKEGLNSIHAFRGGKEAALQQLAALKAVAVAYDEEAAAAASTFNDTLFVTGKQLKAVAFQGVIVLLPYLIKLTTWIFSATTKLRDLMRTSSGLQTAFVLLGGVIVSYIVGSFLKSIVTVKAFGAALLRVMSIVFRFVIPFLVLEDIITWLRGGDSVLGRMLDKFKPMAKDSKQWLDYVKEGIDKALAAWEKFDSALRVFRAWITGDDTLLQPGDIIADQAILEAWEELKKRIKELATSLWAEVKPILIAGLKKMWDDIWAPDGEGTPEESAVARVGVDVSKWILIAMAAQFAMKNAWRIVAIAFQAGLWLLTKSARVIGMVLGLLFQLSMMIPWGNVGLLISTFAGMLLKLAATAVAAGVTLGGSIISGIATAMSAVAAAISLPVMAAIVVLLAVVFLLFSERGREIAHAFGEKIVDGLKALGRVLKRVFKTIFGGLDTIFDTITFGMWGRFRDAAVKALEFVGDKIADLFGPIAKFLGINDKFREFIDNIKSINWGSEGASTSSAPQSILDDLAAMPGVKVGEIPNQTVINDNRSVSQNFETPDPTAVRKASEDAVRWIDANPLNPYLDQDELF